MATADVRKSALGIVQEVQRKLGVNTTSTLTATKLAETLLDYLNDVIDEISDIGDWQQMFREVTVSASSSLSEYEIAASSQVKNIYEVAWSDDAAPLENRTIQDIRRLQRITSFGIPRQFTIVGVSGVNPIIRVYPVPNSAVMSAASPAAFDVAYYKKPGIIVAASASATPAFPSRMLVQGVYAKALLEESGGTPTPEYQTAYTEYLRMRKEALNRFNADTGTEIRLVPTGRYG